jgi:SAM-dependent methyltransferase
MRQATLLAGITKEMRGIEIAPWFAPLAPKRQGYNCLALDVFDKTTLLERARQDPNISLDELPAIEDVELVGSATDIVELVPAEQHGAFDYIVSSHNFEHLPDPISFLQGCEKVLKRNGILSMALPDARACFDFFRPHTTLAEWLTSFQEKRQKPNAQQVFQARAYSAFFTNNEQENSPLALYHDLKKVKVDGALQAAYDEWLSSSPQDKYKDVHCTVMTPASFEMLILECRYLGLISMELESLSGPHGCEFFVRLRNSGARLELADINELRTDLMRKLFIERSQRKRPPLRKMVGIRFISLTIRGAAMNVWGRS